VWGNIENNRPPPAIKIRREEGGEEKREFVADSRHSVKGNKESSFRRVKPSGASS